MDDPNNNGGFTPSDPNQGGMGGDQLQAPVADPNAVPETPVSEPAPEQQPQPEVPQDQGMPEPSAPDQNSSDGNTGGAPVV